ncbi:MAG: DUF4136 domain-containing protein [bacterium]
MKIGAILILVGLAGLMVGCSSYSVNFDYDQQADFASYKTFAWMQEPSMVVGGGQSAERVKTLLDKRVHTAVDAQLEAKGLEMVDPDKAELFVAYHASVENKLSVTDWGYSYPGYWGGWYGGGRDIDVTEYKEGTLIVDLVDAASKQLVWRGIATGVLATNPTPEQMDKNLNTVVTKMFKDYPPKK